MIAPVIASLKTGKHGRPAFFTQLAAQAVPPAMGYEFVEDGQSVCAIQTFGGLYKETGRMVWMHRRLEARDKLRHESCSFGGTITVASPIAW